MVYDPDNVFAKIIRKEIPCDVMYEDEHLLAFNDIQKAAPIHILLIPKGPFTSFDDFATKATTGEISHFFKTAQIIARQHGLAETGYRLVTNCGPNALQMVPHFHLHILGQSILGAFAAAAMENIHVA